jgi:hypothetical protein
VPFKKKKNFGDLSGLQANGVTDVKDMTVRFFCQWLLILNSEIYVVSCRSFDEGGQHMNGYIISVSDNAHTLCSA